MPEIRFSRLRLPDLCRFPDLCPLCFVKMPLGLAMLNLSTSDGKLPGQ
jgi:hypothetical protein